MSQAATARHFNSHSKTVKRKEECLPLLCTEYLLLQTVMKFFMQIMKFLSFEENNVKLILSNEFLSIQSWTKVILQSQNSSQAGQEIFFGFENFC